MTVQTTRKAVFSGLISAFLAVGLLFGAAAPRAHADVLDDLAQEYSIGAGAGQLANLLKASLQLRQQGFRPSKASYQAITNALDYRPNQKPLIEALSNAVSYQQKIKAQTAMISQGQNANSAVMGAGQMPGDSRPATGMSPGDPGNAVAPLLPPE